MENLNLQQDTVGFAQYDALRIECEDRLEKQAEKLHEEKEKEVKRWQRALTIVSATLLTFIVSIILLVVYIFSNYDFATYDYSQNLDGYGNNSIAGGNNEVSDAQSNFKNYQSDTKKLFEQQSKTNYAACQQKLYWHNDIQWRYVFLQSSFDVSRNTNRLELHTENNGTVG